MSEELAKKVQSMLVEEKWTRATISNFSKSNLGELAVVVDSAIAEDCIDEVKQICDEHLQHTKNSIIALYISGMLALKKHSLDNSAMETLVGLLLEHRKNNIVVHLCETILQEDGTNKFAMRTLADCYREEGNEKIWDIYEQIVRLDHEEADIAKLLAERCEKQQKTEEAVEYYKKAIHRFINQKSLNPVKEIWSKLVALIPQEIDFFFRIQRQAAKTIAPERSVPLLQELYQYYSAQKQWDTAIDILKLILSIDPKDGPARRELVECFRGKYAGHSQLEACIRISNLTQGFRDVFAAIADFEKRIAFDEKNFVFHRSWGVGVIMKVQGEQLTINFGKNFGMREMSLEMAVKALQSLSR
ncbi:MAG: transcription elongation factor GreA, partial [Spirochaetaceae bacterium]|nr:transcription elongation factor GreA [Spirochaetaceae bacterium]